MDRWSGVAKPDTHGTRFYVELENFVHFVFYSVFSSCRKRKNRGVIAFFAVSLIRTCARMTSPTRCEDSNRIGRIFSRVWNARDARSIEKSWKIIRLNWISRNNRVTRAWRLCEKECFYRFFFQQRFFFTFLRTFFKDTRIEFMLIFFVNATIDMSTLNDIKDSDT